MIILLNFTSKPSSVNTGIDLSKAKLLIDNYETASAGKELKAYEAAVYEISL